MGDCSFRKGAGAVRTQRWANEICWIDASGLTATSKGVIKKIGGYTLTFDTAVATDGNLGTATNPSWDQAAFGKVGTGFFERYQSSTVNDVLQLTAKGSNASSRITLNNVTLTDPSGKAVPDFRLMVADAESTGAGGPGELISVDNSSGGVEKLDRLTPSGSRDACPGMYGEGNEPGSWAYAGGRSRDFVCYNRSTGTYGTFVASAPMTGNNPSVEISMGTNGPRGAQAIALGIGLGRVAAGANDQLATVDSAFEKATAGTAPSADYALFLRSKSGDAPLNVSPNSTVPVVRQFGAEGVPLDAFVFKSKLSTQRPADAFNRYNPVWSCTLTTASGDASTFAVQEGSVPAGFTLNKNQDTGTSELVVSAPENRQVDCSVKWQSRFQPASLELGKNVAGNAAGFRDMLATSFDLTYACKDVNSGGINFSTAYPDVKLTNTVRVDRGTSQTVSLPKGAQCTVTEKTSSPPPPGTSLDLQWNQATLPGTPPASPNNGTNPYQVTLGSQQPSNAVDKAAATNRYDYRSGTLTLTKGIVGPPVDDGFRMPEYRFELLCPATNMPRREEVMTMSGGTQGSVVFRNVPVGQSCTIRPLTDLTDEQGKTYRFVSRTATLNGNEILPDRSANNGYPFVLPDVQGASSTMHFSTAYAYQVRDITVHKNIDGPAASSKDFDNLSFTVNYKCTTPARKEFTGTVVLTGDQGENVIKDIPVGSDCNIWEEPQGDTANTQYKGTVLTSADGSEKVTTVNNSEGQKTAVLKVWPSQGTQRNLVNVTNTYDYKLTPVTLKKNVDSHVPVGVPSSFTFRFDCGVRNIGSQVVPLTGTAIVQGGQTVTLSANDNSANDSGRAMQVPYGNTCTFREDQPAVGPGIVMSSDAANKKLTVGASSYSVEMTNTFNGAGNGLTISQSFVGETSIFPNPGEIAYTLTCSAAAASPTLARNEAVPEKDQKDGDPVDGEANAEAVGAFAAAAPTELSPLRIALKNGESVHIDADSLPKGSTCVLQEETPDNLVRTNFKGETYNIDRETTVTTSDPEGVGLGAPFVIGSQSVINITDTYSYKPSSISLTKHVAIDPVTAEYFSDGRVASKRERLFPVKMWCKSPAGDDEFNISTSVKDGQVIEQQNIVPEGSVCGANEGSTTTSTGVSLATSVKVDMNNGQAIAKDGPGIEFTAFEGNDTITFTNLYTRQVADVSMEKKAFFPGNIRQEYGSQEDLQQILNTHTFQMSCFDPGYEGEGPIFTATSYIKGEGRTTFPGVPEGVTCKITGDHFGSLQLQPRKNAAGQDLTAYIKPAYVDWVTDPAGGDAQENLSDDTTTSPDFTVNDPTASPNQIALTNHYEYQMAPVTLRKTVAGNDADLKLLSKDTQFHFATKCEVIGYQTNTLGGGNETIPTSLGVHDLSSGRTFVSGSAMVPAGSLCTFTELSPSGVPEELGMTIEAGSNEDPDSSVRKPNVAVGRAPAPEAAQPTEFAFVDTFKRQDRTVRVVMRQGGYLAGADASGYSATFTCDGSPQTLTVPLSDVATGQLPTNGAPVAGGWNAQLPAGAKCQVSFDGSPALNPRGQIEVVDGNRRPYMRYASWTDGQYSGADRQLLNTPFKDVKKTASMYTYSFTVPSSAATEFVLGAEFFHPRAKYDVAFRKLSKGSEGEGKRFEFSAACGESNGDGTFALKDGETRMIKQVPVDSTCTIAETTDGNDEVNSVLSAQADDDGSLLGNIGTNNQPSAEQGTESTREVSFVVNPTSGADTATSGSRWALTATNSFPGMKVEKRIPGAPISAVTGAVADRALLGEKAASFDISYTVSNSGVMDIREIQLKEPTLAGRTVTSTTGKTYVVGSDGVIPSDVCIGLSGTLAPEATTSCTITVDISQEPTDKNFSYFGAVEVSGKVDNQTIAATDSFGVLRLSGVLGALLPATGAQTLVWLLVLGLLVFGYGAYRVLRRNDDEDAVEDRGHYGTD